MEHAMRHLMNLKIAVPCALMTIVLGSLSACADAVAASPGYEVATRTVKYGDLDVTRSPGAATLYSRIRHAAQQVCEPASSAEARYAVLLSRHCMEQSIARAVADVNAPALTSYHLSKTKPVITLARQP
jgi:UrcA family protein